MRPKSSEPSLENLFSKYSSLDEGFEIDVADSIAKMVTKAIELEKAVALEREEKEKMSTTKPKKPFDGGYKIYDPDTEGYGSEGEWGAVAREPKVPVATKSPITVTPIVMPSVSPVFKSERDVCLSAFAYTLSQIAIKKSVETPYTVLGVSESLTLPEIRSFYRRLKRRFDPDYNPDNQAEYSHKINQFDAAMSEIESRLIEEVKDSELDDFDDSNPFD